MVQQLQQQLQHLLEVDRLQRPQQLQQDRRPPQRSSVRGMFRISSSSSSKCSIFSSCRSFSCSSSSRRRISSSSRSGSSIWRWWISCGSRCRSSRGGFCSSCSRRISRSSSSSSWRWCSWRSGSSCWKCSSSSSCCKW